MVALWPAALVFGIAAILVGRPELVVLDGLTGFALTGLGLAARSLRPRSASGPILAAGHPRADRPGTDERRTILRAVGRLHEAFRGQRVDGACTVEDRLQFLGAHVMAHEATGPEALPRWIRSSWEVFFDLAPADVADAVAAIHDNPGSLADQLATAETTLIHGDLWAPNIGRTPERVILLDWALACQAPSEMELAFGVLWNSTFMNVTPETLLNEIRANARDRLDERTMLLALLGEFVSGAGARGWAWNSVNGL